MTNDTTEAALSDDDILAFYHRHLARADALGGAPVEMQQHLRQHYIDGVRLNPIATAAIVRSRDHLAGLYLEEGEVEVSTAVLLIDHDDVQVWEVDLVTKYADVLGYGSDMVLLHATEHTIKANESQRGKATRIRLGLPVQAGWSVVAECARYTCQIVAYRYPQESENPDPVTSGGVVLTDAVCDDLAAEAERGYDPETLIPRTPADVEREVAENPGPIVRDPDPAEDARRCGHGNPIDACERWIEDPDACGWPRDDDPRGEAPPEGSFPATHTPTSGCDTGSCTRCADGSVPVPPRHDPTVCRTLGTCPDGHSR
jgi:hypothetical protein